MSTAVTLENPESILERLLKRSEAEGRSLDETAAEVLVAGLGELPDEGWRALGSMVAVPPSRRYNQERIRQLRAGLNVATRGMMEELDWVRGSLDE